MSPSPPETTPAGGAAATNTSAGAWSPTYSDSTRMLDFAVRWYHFGGGSTEDIFVLFGVDRGTFHRRMTAVLDDPTLTIGPELRTAMLAVYGHR